MNVIKLKRTIPDMVPKQLSFLYWLNPKDIAAALAFLFKTLPVVSFPQKLCIVKRLYAISHNMDCRHSENEIISFLEVILSQPARIPGCVVEAGCYKGGSTAKFSLAAKIANRKLIVFDSFQGLPDHSELLDNDIVGWHFHPPGSFAASLDDVKKNVARFGELEICEFVKGWFDNTMPDFSQPVSAIFLDVDLASSTRTCLKYLYPLLSAGGTLYSNDGYSPLVCDVFRDDEFWRSEVGCPRPPIKGLGKQKVIKILKPIAS